VVFIAVVNILMLGLAVGRELEKLNVLSWQKRLRSGLSAHGNGDKI
jgi:hypothetical protein